MKKFLFMTGLLCLITLFIPQEEINSVEQVIAERQAVMKEKYPDVQHKIEILSNDMKSNNFLVPRRNVQSFHYAFHNRIPRGVFKIIQDIRLKGFEQSQKVSEHNSHCQTIYLSSLLCRNASHVFALRKLII